MYPNTSELTKTLRNNELFYPINNIYQGFAYQNKKTISTKGFCTNIPLCVLMQEWYKYKYTPG